MPANTVALMARFPLKGKVKTRLAAKIGEDKALSIYKALLTNTIDRCRPDKAANYSFGIAVTPKNLLEQFESEYPGLDFYFPQGGSDLGNRMDHALGHILSDNETQKAVLIGADIPNLSREIIKNAFTQLEEKDLVFGPTDDGGYYLIGMKQSCRWIFEGTDWDCDDVLAQSLILAGKQDRSYGLLEKLSDLDQAEDLRLFPFLEQILFNQ